MSTSTYQEWVDKQADPGPSGPQIWDFLGPIQAPPPLNHQYQYHSGTSQERKWGPPHCQIPIRAM